ncbi:VOC family protein [Deinococcus yunweiensis]|uniref:VOC family protein n=1 Tax=Deinococcus yunweiensis TaxID=367282 RepID=UPI00398F3659
MEHAVVHFEIIGRDPRRLRHYYAELFGWSYDTGHPVAPEISEPGEYGFMTPAQGGPVVAGGIAGGPGYAGHVIVYVGVPDVEVALTRAAALGGTRVLGPVARPDGQLVIGHFRDPEGHLMGVAGSR